MRFTKRAAIFTTETSSAIVCTPSRCWFWRRDSNTWRLSVESHRARMSRYRRMMNPGTPSVMPARMGKLSRAMAMWWLSQHRTFG